MSYQQHLRNIWGTIQLHHVRWFCSSFSSVPGCLQLFTHPQTVPASGTQRQEHQSLLKPETLSHVHEGGVIFIVSLVPQPKSTFEHW